MQLCTRIKYMDSPTLISGAFLSYILQKIEHASLEGIEFRRSHCRREDRNESKRKSI